MPLRFAPNGRTPNLSLTANAVARFSSIVSIGWDDVTGKPDFDALYEPIAASGVDYEITSGASYNVMADARTVRVNKTVGSATTVQMPAGSGMEVQDTVVVDWKNDADVNNITILPFGTEKINGLSSWTIAAQGGSVRLRPIPDVGYALA